MARCWNSASKPSLGIIHKVQRSADFENSDYACDWLILSCFWSRSVGWNHYLTSSALWFLWPVVVGTRPSSSLSPASGQRWEGRSPRPGVVQLSRKACWKACLDLQPPTRPYAPCDAALCKHFWGDIYSLFMAAASPESWSGSLNSPDALPCATLPSQETRLKSCNI